jgi:hypothetical protein
VERSVEHELRPNGGKNHRFQTNLYSPESTSGGIHIFYGGADGRITQRVEGSSEGSAVWPSVKGSEVPFKFAAAMASHFQCIYEWLSLRT